MKWFYTFRWWLKGKTHPPCVMIGYFGQRTPKPQVHVSVWSIYGTQGVYTWDADSVGEAKATMYGEGLAKIMQRRLVDNRKTQLQPLRPYYPPHENMVYTAAAKYNKWDE